MLEGHRDPVGLLVDRADGVPEQVLPVVAGRFVEDGSQPAAHDLDVPSGGAGDQLARLKVDSPTVTLHERDVIGPGPVVDESG
jgi:hypothetical protein